MQSCVVVLRIVCYCAVVCNIVLRRGEECFVALYRVTLRCVVMICFISLYCDNLRCIVEDCVLLKRIMLYCLVL